MTNKTTQTSHRTFWNINKTDVNREKCVVKKNRKATQTSHGTFWNRSKTTVR